MKKAVFTVLVVSSLLGIMLPVVAPMVLSEALHPAAPAILERSVQVISPEKSQKYKVEGASILQKTWIDEVISLFPEEFTASLQTIRIDMAKDARRGLGGAGIIILGANGLSKHEFQSVLIHEIGHVVDLGLMKGNSLSSKSSFKDGAMPIYENDPSVVFYQISWQNEQAKRSDSKPENFVSRYGATDSFEDFAESFLAYRKHGALFRILASEDAALQKKYDFLKNEVFAGKEFDGGNTSLFRQKRVWDITKL